MNEEIKEKWLEALRSDDYIQGKRQLKGLTKHGGDCYCCLGVLTDLYAKDHGLTFKEATLTAVVDGMKSALVNATLCPRVRLWAGLDDSDPMVQAVNTETGRPSNVTLSALNDDLYPERYAAQTFTDLADLIKAHL